MGSKTRRVTILNARLYMGLKEDRAKKRGDYIRQTNSVSDTLSVSVYVILTMPNSYIVSPFSAYLPQAMFTGSHWNLFEM